MSDLESISQIITLIFAGFAALLSWLNFRKSGSQKLAQFRKEWIENLRIHLAEYNSLRFRIHTTTQAIEHAKKTNKQRTAALTEKRDEALKRMGYVIAYIRLMMNEGEPLHDQLNEMISDHLEKSFNIPEASRKKFITLCRKVLKTEWEKAKSEM